MALTAKRPSRGDEARKRIMQDIKEGSEKKRRLNAEIEDSLYRRIKIRAAEENRTISEITRELWVEFLGD
ncbi:MAG: hypothetical protein CL949_11335 [Erythrobacter sp.]|jgi:hypothetical protein|nr:hypothetical protein [Erythrobacter sp.]|tara:strand:+ start:569 stop:778 length:210 start_codon:yes stop_codon:yes gene_type:complete